jgi:phosphoribosylformylglycinamidine synthase subunit PurQ / glutaminase
MAVRALVLRTAGINCDVETQFAWEKAGAVADRVHINRIIEQPRTLLDYQILTIPGGFSYGDDIASGKIFANQLVHHLADVLHEFLAADRLVLGICNGFQVLVKCDLLPGSAEGRPSLALAATLTNNDSGKFECRWVYIKVNKKSPCVFTKGITGMYVPIAHGEGKLVAAPGLADKLNVVVQYTDEKWKTKAGYPANPNGSVNDIAGICDPTGRIFGMMPHPEDFIRWTQHPRWTREKENTDLYGLQIFTNAVNWAKSI